MSGLVLSLFPGIGLLDMAFEAEGFCVVRGPDLLWGGDVRQFHPPAGKFDGVIGGPPCQRFSRLAHIVKAVHGESALAPNLIPEFERVIAAAAPRWFLMENVPAAPTPMVLDYVTERRIINNRWIGGVQNRERCFTFGLADVVGAERPLGVFGRALSAADRGLDSAIFESAVCSSAGGRRASVRFGGSGKRKQASLLKARSIAKECVLQGLPPDYLDGAPFTERGKRRAIGNGVPLPLGRAVARAVKRAIEGSPAGESGPGNGSSELGGRSGT